MKTTVVHLITLLELGGAQGNTLYTVNHLNPNAFDVHLWCGKGAYWDEEAQKTVGTHNRLRYFSRLVRPVHPFYDLIVIIDLWRALRALKPAVLHTHSSKAGIVGRLAGRLAGIPMIIHTFHGFGFNDQQKPLVRWLFVQLERWIAPLSTKLIFVSESNRDLAQTLRIGQSSQYELLRSGVPIQRIKQEAFSANVVKLKKELNIPAAAPLVTTIGPFKPQKNLTDFIQMAIGVYQINPSVHFLIVGDGSERPLLEALIKRLGLSANVHLPGWRRDAAQILAASTVFAMTSLWEGLPRSLVEAQIVGVPSVCYDTDGVREILQRGGGFLVPQRQVPEMTDRVLNLIADQTLWNDLSQKAKTSIARDFDIDEMVKQQEHLYKPL